MTLRSSRIWSPQPRIAAPKANGTGNGCHLAEVAPFWKIFGYSYWTWNLGHKVFNKLLWGNSSVKNVLFQTCVELLCDSQLIVHSFRLLKHRHRSFILVNNSFSPEVPRISMVKSFQTWILTSILSKSRVTKYPLGYFLGIVMFHIQCSIAS